MTKAFPLSVHEEEAICQLGGFDYVIGEAERILREHGVLGSLFTAAEKERIRQGRYYRKKSVALHFDSRKSLNANIEDLLSQAEEVQAKAGVTTYVGAMMQHLVGAMLDLVLGQGKVVHRGFAAADSSTSEQGGYQVDLLVVHVTHRPTEALARECGRNLQAGLRPVVVTRSDGAAVAAVLLEMLELADRVDVLDVTQFLTAYVYASSHFQGFTCKVAVSKLLRRYNEIVSECETDPALRIDLTRAG